MAAENPIFKPRDELFRFVAGRVFKPLLTDRDIEALLDTKTKPNPRLINRIWRLWSDIKISDSGLTDEFIANQINSVLAPLSEREQDIVRFRLGMTVCGLAPTIREAAIQFDTSSYRITVIEREALKKLREAYPPNSP